MEAAVVGIAIGIVYLAVAAVVFRQVRGSTRAFPWLAALAAFFVVRGLDRVAETVTDQQPSLIAYVADALVLVTLILLVVGLRRTVDDLRAAHEKARRHEDRYVRALADYERLTKHRLANPLAAIRGGIATVREIQTLSDEERDGLLEMIEREAVRLANISLDPNHLSPEERELRPLPGRVEFPDAA